MPKLGKLSFAKRALAGALAGLPAGVAHAVVNEIDIRAFRHNADDLLMLGGVVADDPAVGRRIGLGMHLTFAMAFGAAWAVALRPKTDSDAVAKGVATALTENTVLWPLVLVVDAYHPQAKSGNLDPFTHRIAFLQANLRHLALGATLGTLYPRIARRLS